MKGAVRLATCASIITLIYLLYLLKNHLQGLCDQYSAGAYLVAWMANHGAHHHSPHRGAVGDKVIVMARLEEDDTNWVQEELPDWQRAIYTVNPSNATVEDSHALITPINKGHESMAYLTYIIDNYHRLPSTIAFLHSHRSGFLAAWHVDAMLHDNVAAMRALQLPFVQENGYVNLRCNWNPGCMESHRVNRHVTEDVWREIFEGTSTPPPNMTTTDGQQPPYTNMEGQNLMQIPRRVGAACCAQFAVSRDQVLKRPRQDYVQFRDWVTYTQLNSASSGRVMEFLWHIIFGKGAVYCPDEELCYCQVYGRC
ncbi:hypothetical protein MAP00_003908 [Monascus purpureus]|nr:hypothetical protein MAP00_003908 [Monascus purpureus]